jgi:Ca2+/Na+ antiporter
MALSDLFVDPSSLPDGAYGLCQLLTLLIGYGYVLFVASNMISDGSELLLLIPAYAGIVGSCVLPVLGAVPDGMIVLFSGMGPDAQNQLDVGVGALAGSTIMLITIPWLLSIYAGRVDVVDGVCKYTKQGKKARGAVTGVPNSPSVRKGGYIMMITSLSYIILQGPAQYFEAQHEDKAEVAKGEKTFALIGLFITIFLFLGYLYYQWKLSLDDNDEVAERRKTEMIIKQIERNKVSIRGALYFELLQYNKDHQLALNTESGNQYNAIATTATDVWNKLPAHAQQRFTSIIKNFWRRFVRKEDDSGVAVAALGKMFASMGEDLSPEEIQNIFKQFDVDHNGSVDLEEFILGTTTYLWEHINTTSSRIISHEVENVKKFVNSAMDSDNETQEEGEEDDEEEDEEEMPEELAGLDPETQQRRLMQMSFTTMGLGTFLVVLFSDPMTDVLGELGTRTGVKAFYVSFVIAPLASNASELIASYAYALKKTPKSISIALQALQGAACMNNTFCLSIFMALIYFQGLAWEYSAETVAIVVCQLGVAIFSAQKIQTMTTGLLVFSLYPLCLILVASLESLGFD